jgi:hypothetical protein
VGQLGVRFSTSPTTTGFSVQAMRRTATLAW